MIIQCKFALGSENDEGLYAIKYRGEMADILQILIEKWGESRLFTQLFQEQQQLLFTTAYRQKSTKQGSNSFDK